MIFPFPMREWKTSQLKFCFFPFLRLQDLYLLSMRPCFFKRQKHHKKMKHQSMKKKEVKEASTSSFIHVYERGKKEHKREGGNASQITFKRVSSLMKGCT